MTDFHSEPLEREDVASGDTAGETAAERTGNPAVDRVLDSLDGLADTPVAEHVAVFEAAHDQLRGALANAGDAAPQQHG